MLSLYLVTLTAPQQAEYHPILTTGKLRFGNVYQAQRQVAEQDSHQVFPTSGSTLALPRPCISQPLRPGQGQHKGWLAFPRPRSGVGK